VISPFASLALTFAITLVSISAEAVSESKTGDLLLAVGYSHSESTGLRSDASVAASGSPYAGFFGTLAELGPLGFDLEVSGRILRHDVVEVSRTTTLTIPLVEAGVGVRVPLVPLRSFETDAIAGGGAAWPIDRTCGPSCPFNDSVPAVTPYLRGTVEARLEKLYGLGLSLDHRPNPLWPETLGATTSLTAALFWNPTAGL
jgi:hypothetical protein